MSLEIIKEILDLEVLKWNTDDFILKDPISIPKKFLNQQDIEIAALFAALFAWGRRDISIHKANDLLTLMNNEPYNFIRHNNLESTSLLKQFKHRTFNGDDILYILQFLQQYYKTHTSLEDIFLEGLSPQDSNIGNGIHNFYTHVMKFNPQYNKIKRHISTPLNGSACKRLNLFLRWMVRKDNRVDFGLWTKIKPSLLVCPCDVHVIRTAIQIGLIRTHKVNWNIAVELTEILKKLDPIDPVRYDFGLFGMGIHKTPYQL